MNRARKAPDETFGERLQQLRQRQAWTVRDLFVLTGIAESTLRSYENDERTPSLKKVLHLALVFRVDHIWLLTGKRVV